MQAILYIRESGTEQIRCFQAQETAATYQFTFAPFRGTPSSFWMREVEAVKSPVFHFNDVLPKATAQSEHVQLIADAVEAIKTHNWGKIVVARAEVVEASFNAVEVFKQLCETYSNATVYLFSSSKTGTWMGATPELLVDIRNNQLKTMSLAGTRKKGAEQSFTQKEVQEQSMVTDFIVEQLKAQSGIEDVKLSEPKLAEAGNLVHYKTTIQASLKDGFDEVTLLNALHPTPAVAGLPRGEALAFLEQHEKLDRSFYSGYFGLKSNEKATYYVNLRCLQLFQSSYALYAGGGITHDSNPVLEWEETVAKMDTLRNVLAKS